MIMEEKLTRLFTDYDPELSPDNRFMSRLQHNLETVELLKRQTEAMQRKNRLAVAVAAITGFLFGIVTTLLYPSLSAMAGRIAAMGTVSFPLFASCGEMLLWGIIGLTGFLIVYSAYDITLSATRKQTSVFRTDL